MNQHTNPLPPLSENQERALDFALDRSGSAWFMPPGMGKTRTWLELIRETGGRTLVFAPKLVCMNTWPRENKKWGHRFPMRFAHGKEKHFRGKELITLVNPEAAPWVVEKLRENRVLPYDQVIFDELSKWKNPASVRMKAWLKDGFGDKFKYRQGGTGTPVGAHLKDLFGEMRVCDRGRSLGTDYERFERQYFSFDKYTNKLEPWHDTEERLLDAIADRALSFDINDLDMPPLQHIPHYLDMPPAVRLHYERMHDESVVEELDLYAANAAVRSGKLRQMASGGVIAGQGESRERKYLHDAKAEYLAEILDEHDGRPVMVFFEFLSDYESICRVLRRQVPALYGGTKVKEANKIVNEWNAGRTPVLALHPRSAAYGLNLQDSGNVIVWYTVPWSYEMLNQGTARLWRQGQKNKVLCYYLIISDTIDEDVFERVEDRGATHDRVMKGLL